MAKAERRADGIAPGFSKRRGNNLDNPKAERDGWYFARLSGILNCVAAGNGWPLRGSMLHLGNPLALDLRSAHKQRLKTTG